jgi:prepilin-type processing-associated H-X9-DG protein
MTRMPFDTSDQSPLGKSHPTAGLIVAAAFLFFSIEASGRAENESPHQELPSDLALIPADALGFMWMSFLGLWDPDAAKRLGLSIQAQEFDRQAELNLGVRLSDIEYVTTILLAPEPPTWEPQFLGAIRTHRPYSREKVQIALAPSGGKEEQRQGRTYFVPHGKKEPAIYFVDDRVFLVAQPSVLRKYFTLSASSREPKRIRGALELAGGGHQAAGWLRLPPGLAPLAKQAILPPTLNFLKPLLEMQSGTLVWDSGRPGSIRMRLEFPTEDAAAAGTEAVRTGVGILKQKLAAIPQRSKQDFVSIVVQTELLRVLGTARVERQSCTVTVTSASFSPALYTVLPSAVQDVRAAAQRVQSSNKLKRILLAMYDYEDKYDHFPPAAITDADGKPLLSWRVAILPFLDQKALYKEFHLGEPWDSAHNKKLLNKMPAIYAPVTSGNTQPFLTFYQVFTGKGTVFEGAKGMHIANIGDGTSMTILAVEAAQAVPWTKPEDLVFDPAKPLPQLGGMFPNGFNAVFCDGSVRFFKRTLPEATLRALITANGGEIVILPDD